jgi:hypothetical protein
MRGGWALGVTLGAGLLAGCATTSSVETASTIGKGHFQIGAEPGVQYGGISGYPQTLYPHIDVAFRYGLSDRIDLGARTGFSLADLKFKYLFTDPKNEDLAIAIGPQAGGIILSNDKATDIVLRLDVPLLIGIKNTKGGELVIGPRFLAWLIVAPGNLPGTTANIITAGPGLSVGYAIKLSETFRLMPEVAFAVPLGASVQEISKTLNISGTGTLPFAPVFQIKVGLLFGRAGPTEGLPPPAPEKDPNELTPPPPPPPVTHPGGDPSVPPPPETPPPPPSSN